ncbi:MAG: hypothetical protein LBQ50_00785 [Planctomycetaceae bacterium]|nr:hypothetical protein [Planctomycetaceae bacterium]
MNAVNAVIVMTTVNLLPEVAMEILTETDSSFSETPENPIYWLEIRQTRRNYLFYVILFFGILSGILPFCLTYFDFPNWFASSPDRIILFLPSFYLSAFGSVIIPLFCGLKLASQQLNNDLTLRTPLLSRSILWGKLQVGLTLSVCLYTPSFPAAFFWAFNGEPAWLLFCSAAPILTACLTMIALGFLAGSKTPVLRGVLVCLCFVFLIANSPLLLCFFGCIGQLFHDPTFLLPCFFGVAFSVTLLTMISGLIFWMGIALFFRNPNLIHVLFGMGILIVLMTPIPLLILLVLQPPWFSVLGTILIWTAYFFSPVLAVYCVMKYQ